MPPAHPGRQPHMAMLVGNQVIGDSRVEKAAVSAMRAGYRVTLVGLAHRTAFRLDRYGSVPILRAPADFPRHRAWSLMHAEAYMDRTRWEAALPEAVAEDLAGHDMEEPPGLGIAHASARGAAPHATPDALRGAVARRARALDRRLASVDLPRTGLVAVGAARARRALGNLRSAHRQGWRRTWPMIADYEDAFLRVLLELDPDIVHVHDRHPLPAAAAFARAREALGLPHVPWVYDAHEWLPGQAMPGPVDQRIGWKAAEAEFVHDADAVLSVTDELAERMRDHHGLATLPRTVVNAPWATRAPLDPDDRRTLREECGLDADTPLLVYVGKLAEVRGIQTVVEALPLLPGVHAAFVGSPDRGPRERLVERAEALGVADRVHLLDYVPSASVTWYVESATVGVSPLLPTPAHESAVPTKLREYVQSGLPMVVSDLREQARFVTDQGIGTVHAPGDSADFARAVRTLLEDLPAHRASVSSPAVQDAHRWEGAERVLHEVWGSLLPAGDPLPAEIAPDRAREEPPTRLVVVGAGPASEMLASAWRGTGGGAEVRTPRAAPEEPTRLAGPAGELERVLQTWMDDDRHAAVVLYTGQGPASGRTEGSERSEMLSLLARGRGVGVLAGETPLVSPALITAVLPDHPWAELDGEARERLERQCRRAARPFGSALPAGVPLLSHRWVDSVLDPRVTWLPRPVPTAVAGETSAGPREPRSVLIVPGDRTAAERAAVEALGEVLARRGVEVLAPSAERLRRRGTGAFAADLVLDPLHTGEPSSAAEAGWARGATVVGGPVLARHLLAAGDAVPPVVVTDDAGLLDLMERLLAEGPAERQARSAAGRAHHERVHSPAAVVARLRAVTGAAGPSA